MTEPEQVALQVGTILAQVEARRAEAERLLAENPPVVESVTERLRRVDAKQRRDRAERVGRLDVGGAA
jgi:hypothetical protein